MQFSSGLIQVIDYSINAKWLIEGRIKLAHILCLLQQRHHRHAFVLSAYEKLESLVHSELTFATCLLGGNSDIVTPSTFGPRIPLLQVL